jgi:hypothetical protein
MGGLKLKIRWAIADILLHRADNVLQEYAARIVASEAAILSSESLLGTPGLGTRLPGFDECTGST